MISKILLTLLIIIGAVMVLRVRHSANRPPISQPGSTALEDSETNKTVRLALILFVIFTGVGGLAFGWAEWREAHRILNIRVIAGDGKAVTYKAYKGDLKGRSFETLDGRQVTIADSERFEVTEPED